jgi:hypothetical protein
MIVICVVIPCIIRITVFTGINIAAYSVQKVLEMAAVVIAGFVSLGIAVLLFYSMCSISLFLK